MVRTHRNGQSRRLVTKKDIVYRANAAGVKAIVCVNDDFVISQADLISCSILYSKIIYACHNCFLLLFYYLFPVEQRECDYSKQ